MPRHEGKKGKEPFSSIRRRDKGLSKKPAPSAYDRRIEENMGLVYNIARRFAGYGHDVQDLIQVGSIGLIKAARRYDPGFGTCFSTYAVPLIIGEIRRYLRDQTPVSMSRASSDLLKRALKLRSEMSAGLGQEPTNEEVAGKLGIDVSELVYLLEAYRPPLSIHVGDADEPEFAGGKGSGRPLEWSLTDESDPESRWAEKASLSEALEELEPRERFVIIERFLRDRKQADIAERLGISQAQISRIEKAALSKIRAKVQ
ncbi:MAG TPA: sigma-70 family RNA polymerase sigma factor [Clostridia bacterium]|nr:sigma-70 family RNA polymerase sigma factor [Clostridia bacterium]